MSKLYEPEFKNKIVRLHLEEGRTYKSLQQEYGVSKSAAARWCEEYSKGCLESSLHDPNMTNKAELMKENLRLRRELDERNKEILFLKKAAAFFAKEIG